MPRTRYNVFYDIYNQPYDDNIRLKLYKSTKSSLQLIQRMSLLKKLDVHYGCVNSICWNDTGNIILSGSDDQHLVLTNIYNYQILADYKTSHRANIFSAKFLPNSGDTKIVSCSGDGIILYTDLHRKIETFHNQFNCHSGTTYEIITVPNEPNSFLSCGEDGCVRWFDLRIKDKCNNSRCKEDILIPCKKAVTAMSVNPAAYHQVAIGCADSTVKVFDRRFLGTLATGWKDAQESVRSLYSFSVPEFEGNPYRITSLSYCPDGHDILVSYSSDHLYLFSIKDQGSIQLKKELANSTSKAKRHSVKSPQPVRRLRLRGDWSDTGPDARPEREGGRRTGTEIAQARPVLHTSLMQIMTNALSRILNDPATRAALSGGGEDSLERVIQQQAYENPQGSNTNQSDQPTDVAPDSQNTSMSHASNSMEIDSSFSEVENSRAAEQPSQPHSDETEFYSSQMEAESSHNEIVNETQSSVENEQPIDQRIDIDNSSIRDSESNEGSSSVMENLQDRLTYMRDGFLERHGSEPAVQLTYSDKSSSSATISMGVADEITREKYNTKPTVGHQPHNDLSLPGPSTSGSKASYSKSLESNTEDIYSDDSDDDLETVRSNDRGLNIEREMDEAIENARASQGQDIYDDSCLTDLRVKQKYTGHRNARTMIKEANFWGDDFVMSGSDCGHVFIWDRRTAKLCMLLEADQHVVNCLQPHPFLPILATSGIDYDVKLWAPINEEAKFDEVFAEDLKKRNAVMLEETKDTITVPAVFMIRMLACLNQIRRGRGRNRRRSGDDSNAPNERGSG